MFLKLLVVLGLVAAATCRDSVKSLKLAESAKGYNLIKSKVAQYNAISKGLEDDIIAQIEMFQDWMINGNPDLGIPVLDPLVVETVEYGTSTDQITFNVVLDGISVVGLATFSIVDLDVNLLQLKFGGTINVPELHFTADHYYLDGVIGGILPLFGEGAADLTIHNLNLTATAKLTTENDQVGIKDLAVAVAFDSISGQIENLLGSDLDDVINDIINILGAEIFDSVAEIVSGDVAVALQDAINAQLVEAGFSLQDLIDLITGGKKTGSSKALISTAADADEKQGNANDYLDAILENVREFLVTNGWDNYTLPDMVEGFSEEWAGITWHGEAMMTNGFLAGLQTIHRAGDAQLEVNGDDGSITLTGTIEFFDFEAGYAMYVGFMDIGIDATAAVAISSVQVSLKARLIVNNTAELEKDDKNFIVEIEELNITNPGLVTVEIHGLGVLDFLLDGLGFIVGNVFGGLIFDAIEGPIRDAITNALGEVLPYKYITP